jgi:hypothetical protein
MKRGFEKMVRLAETRKQTSSELRKRGVTDIRVSASEAKRADERLLHRHPALLL